MLDCSQVSALQSKLWSNQNLQTVKQWPCLADKHSVHLQPYIPDVARKLQSLCVTKNTSLNMTNKDMNSACCPSCWSDWLVCCSTTCQMMTLMLMQMQQNSCHNSCRSGVRSHCRRSIRRSGHLQAIHKKSSGCCIWPTVFFRYCQVIVMLADAQVPLY